MNWCISKVTFSIIIWATSNKYPYSTTNKWRTLGLVIYPSGLHCNSYPTAEEKTHCHSDVRAESYGAISSKQQKHRSFHMLTLTKLQILLSGIIKGMTGQRNQFTKFWVQQRPLMLPGLLRTSWAVVNASSRQLKNQIFQLQDNIAIIQCNKKITSPKILIPFITLTHLSTLNQIMILESWAECNRGNKFNQS